MNKFLLLLLGLTFCGFVDSDYRGQTKRESFVPYYGTGIVAVSCDLLLVPATEKICENGCGEYIYTMDGIKIGHIHYNRKPDSAKVILCSDVVEKLLRGK